MFEILVQLIAGVALLVFILWEIFGPQKPISRETLEAGFEPGEASRASTFFVLGIAGICFGLYLIANPDHPPFTGAGALLSSILYALFGIYGRPLFLFGLSVLGIAAAFRLRKKRS